MTGADGPAQFSSAKGGPAVVSRGIVVSNHLLACAVDAAIATSFALTVVERMMVGVIDGSHRFIDAEKHGARGGGSRQLPLQAPFA